MSATAKAPTPANGPASGAAATAAVAATSDGSIRCNLDDRGLLRFRGGDAARFLHGQLSTDVVAMEPGQSRLTSYSDARGRLLLVGRVHARDDHLLLELPADRVEPIRQQLAKYVLRADVQIEDVSTEVARIGVAGQSAAIALSPLAGSLPDEPGRSAAAAADMWITRLAGPRPRWQVMGDPDGVRAAWDRLADHAHEVASAEWRLLDIEAGIPSVYTATAGQFVAQMLNLDCLGAIDFNKGCYPGQEVIARTHYLGRIKRRMQLLRVHEDHRAEAIAPGSGVQAGDTRVGEIVDSAPAPGGPVALAVLRIDAGETLNIGGVPAERLALPYRIEDEAA